MTTFGFWRVPDSKNSESPRPRVRVVYFANDRMANARPNPVSLETRLLETAGRIASRFSCPEFYR